jgi:hypothetical protein
MKNMFFAVMFAASPVVAQEFTAEMPAMREILTKTHELKTASAPAPERTPPALRGPAQQALDEIEGLIASMEQTRDPGRLEALNARRIALSEKVERLIDANMAAPAAHAMAVAPQEESWERRTKLADDIEKTKGLIRKYAADPARSGIYNAELGLLQLRLALEDLSGVGAPSSPPKAPATEAERREKRAQLLNDIEKVKEKIRKYGDDSTRHGIYNAELSLLQLELALVNTDGVR